MPEFEVFRKRTLAPEATPKVTIQNRGVLSINRAAYDALGEPKKVELLFDRSSRIMALRPVGRASDDSYPVRPVTESETSFTISAIAFCKFYDIPVKPTRRYPAYMDGYMLCADLNQEPELVTARRAGAVNEDRTDRFGQPVVRRTRPQEPEGVHSASSEDS